MLTSLSGTSENRVWNYFPRYRNNQSMTPSPAGVAPRIFDAPHVRSSIPLTRIYQIFSITYQAQAGTIETLEMGLAANAACNVIVVGRLSCLVSFSPPMNRRRGWRTWPKLFSFLAARTCPFDHSPSKRSTMRLRNKKPILFYIFFMHPVASTGGMHANVWHKSSNFWLRRTNIKSYFSSNFDPYTCAEKFKTTTRFWNVFAQTPKCPLCFCETDPVFAETYYVSHCRPINEERCLLFSMQN